MSHQGTGGVMLKKTEMHTFLLVNSRTPDVCVRVPHTRVAKHCNAPLIVTPTAHRSSDIYPSPRSTPPGSSANNTFNAFANLPVIAARQADWQPRSIRTFI
jgi:hypothetical protein